MNRVDTRRARLDDECDRIGRANRTLMRGTRPDDPAQDARDRRAEALDLLARSEDRALDVLRGMPLGEKGVARRVIATGSLALVRAAEERRARRVHEGMDETRTLWAGARARSRLLENADAGRVREILAVPVMRDGLAQALATHFLEEAEGPLDDTDTLAELAGEDRARRQISYVLVPLVARSARPAAAGRLLAAMVRSYPDDATMAAVDASERDDHLGLALLLMAGTKPPADELGLGSRRASAILRLASSNHGLMALRGVLANLDDAPSPDGAGRAGTRCDAFDAALDRLSCT